MSDASQILEAAEKGDPRAASELLPLVYTELRRLAAQKLAGEKPGQTLDPTGLVHEAYVRLIGDNPEQPWNGRGHFFAAAAEAYPAGNSSHAHAKTRGFCVIRSSIPPKSQNSTAESARPGRGKMQGFGQFPRITPP
jgi:hypothetical protein